MIRKNEVNINQFKEKLKKIELTNSAFLHYVAKNVRITDNKSKSIVFCVFATLNTMLFLSYRKLRSYTVKIDLIALAIVSCLRHETANGHEQSDNASSYRLALI